MATAVYGSYDCPEVWILRRFRDYQLSLTWYGRAYIHIYYTFSPMVVKLWGSTNWIKGIIKPCLDAFVKKLNSNGIENSPYKDIEW